MSTATSVAPTPLTAEGGVEEMNTSAPTATIAYALDPCQPVSPHPEVFPELPPMPEVEVEQLALCAAAKAVPLCDPLKRLSSKSIAKWSAAADEQRTARGFELAHAAQMADGHHLARPDDPDVVLHRVTRQVVEVARHDGPPPPAIVALLARQREEAAAAEAAAAAATATWTMPTFERASSARVSAPVVLRDGALSWMCCDAATGTVPLSTARSVTLLHMARACNLLGYTHHVWHAAVRLVDAGICDATPVLLDFFSGGHLTPEYTRDRVTVRNDRYHLPCAAMAAAACVWLAADCLGEHVDGDDVLNVLSVSGRDFFQSTREDEDDPESAVVERRYNTRFSYCGRLGMAIARALDFDLHRRVMARTPATELDDAFMSLVLAEALPVSFSAGGVSFFLSDTAALRRLLGDDQTLIVELVMGLLAFTCLAASNDPRSVAVAALAIAVRCWSSKHNANAIISENTAIEWIASITPGLKMFLLQPVPDTPAHDEDERVYAEVFGGVLINARAIVPSLPAAKSHWSWKALHHLVRIAPRQAVEWYRDEILETCMNFERAYDWIRRTG